MVEIVFQKLVITGAIQQNVYPTLQEDTFSTLAKDATLQEHIHRKKSGSKVGGSWSSPTLTLLHMGGGVFKTQVAFDALLDALGVKIERRYFLTIPKYTYRSV